MGSTVQRFPRTCLIPLICMLGHHSIADEIYHSSDDFHAIDPSTLSGTDRLESRPIKRGVDPDRYQLGAFLFGGKYQLPAEAISSELRGRQKRKLAKLQRKLPEAISRFLEKRNLPGRMTEVEFKALLYFLDVRYLNRDQYYAQD